jgi:methylmalonyl-CoA/ethylmalonyl-CoA epimerase
MFDSAIPVLGTPSPIPLINETGGRPGQLGIVVANLDLALAFWGGQAHVSPGWRVGVYDTETWASATYRAMPGSFSMRVALGGANPNIELIQPLRGENVYTEWLDHHGPGLQHIGWYVDDVVASTEAMVDAGFELVQSGMGCRLDGTGGFSYFDTIDEFGFMLEAIQAPKI